MDTSVELFIILIVAGLFLLGVEVFVPGGVIGALGVLALLGAVVTGFVAFGPQGGFISAMALVVLSGVFLVIWLKFFPRTGMGRRLTLTIDGKQFKSASESLTALTGKQGIAQTDLHPAGIATIDGQRVDVVAESGYIGHGSPVRVVQVEGFRVVVREHQPAQKA